MIRKKLQAKAAGVLLAAVMMCCMQPNLAYAEDNLEYVGEIQMHMQKESISPMYVQCNRCQSRLDLSGTTANCQVIVKGISGTTKISGLIKLYDNTAGKQVTSWTVSTSKSYYSETKTATVTKGHSYTLSFSGKVYGSNSPSGESVSTSTSGKN